MFDILLQNVSLGGALLKYLSQSAVRDESYGSIESFNLNKITEKGYYLVAIPMLVAPREPPFKR